MPVALVQAQAAVNALAGGTTNAFVGQIAGHAFSDHMSKAAAEAAAQEAVLAAGPGRTRTKGYFERVNEHRIASVADFQALNDKYKERVYGGTGYKKKKPSQLGRFVVHKTFKKTDSMDANDMALLIIDCIKDASDGNATTEYRDGAEAGRFLLFTDVAAVLFPDFVARSITSSTDAVGAVAASVKTGGGGVLTSGLQWAVVVLTAQAQNSTVISAYPSDDAYRLGRPLLV